MTRPAGRSEQGQEPLISANGPTTIVAKVFSMPSGVSRREDRAGVVDHDVETRLARGPDPIEGLPDRAERRHVGRRRACAVRTVLPVSAAATAPSGAGSRPTRTTRAPSAANAPAITFPSPDVGPVMRRCGRPAQRRLAAASRTERRRNGRCRPAETADDRQLEQRIDRSGDMSKPAIRDRRRGGGAGPDRSRGAGPRPRRREHGALGGTADGEQAAPTARAADGSWSLPPTGSVSVAGTAGPRGTTPTTTWRPLPPTAGWPPSLWRRRCR